MINLYQFYIFIYNMGNLEQTNQTFLLTDDKLTILLREITALN